MSFTRSYFFCKIQYQALDLYLQTRVSLSLKNQEIMTCDGDDFQIARRWNCVDEGYVG